MATCPFNNRNCEPACQLFLDDEKDDRAKRHGRIEGGICSFRKIALGLNEVAGARKEAAAIKENLEALIGTLDKLVGKMQ